jgi:arginase
MGWKVLGAPVDCMGAEPQTLTPFGTELAPAALRGLGVIERVGAVDHGDLEVRVVGRDRDPNTGLVGGSTVTTTVAGVRSGVRPLLEGGDRVLLLGGCCIPLMGALAAARDTRSGVGLVYIDGHLDLYDHVTSPTGEAADMPTAAALGIGEPGLLAAMDAPVITPERLAIVGPRDPDEPPAVGYLVEELKLAVVEPAEVTAAPSAVAGRVADRAGGSGAFWVHLDVDVFDQEEFPATDYLMPGGLTLETGRQLLSDLAGDQRLLGASVGCYNPEKDPEGVFGRRLVDLLGVITDGR